MTLTTNDTLTQEAVRARFEEITQENLQWRRAYRDLDTTSIDNDVFRIPRPTDTIGQPQAIPEGSEFPRDEENYEKIDIPHVKYGFEVPVSWEATEDSMMDVAADQVDRQARQMAEFLNSVAFEELNNNLNSSSPAGGAGGDDTKLDFADVVDGLTQLRDDKYNPDFMIVNPRAEQDLLTSDEFLRATDLGDDTVQEGQIGRVAGLDIFSANDGQLGSGASGIVVDQDFYGYEAERAPIQTNTYEDPHRQVEVMQIWTRRGFKAIDEQAAIEVTPDGT